MYTTTKENSPQTWLTASVSAQSTAIVVGDTSVLESAPNVMTIGEGQDAELVRYVSPPTGKSYTVQRGFNGTTARAWPAGTAVYRAPTAYDLNAHRIAALYAYAALLGAM